MIQRVKELLLSSNINDVVLGLIISEKENLTEEIFEKAGPFYMSFSHTLIGVHDFENSFKIKIGNKLFRTANRTIYIVTEEYKSLHTKYYYEG